MTTYLKRYAHPEVLFSQPPDKELELVVVIPCYNEPDILTTLKSLERCNTNFKAEVVIIINEREDSPPAVKSTNLRAIQEIKDWQLKNRSQFKLLYHHFVTSSKHAGVGLARKLGMDEAVRRFEAVGNKEGIICCFDADSTCESNYLECVYRHFKKDRMVIGASVYYEHDLPKGLHHSEGIIQYELHLRYYVNALKHISYPSAHQTVGSSMVVRSDAYQRIGGMNKRKAGEDFYFLHRLMPAGKYIDITNTTVYPSSRESDRVPFGTGKAMTKWAREQSVDYHTYNLNSFLDLGALFKAAERFYSTGGEDLRLLKKELPVSVISFLEHENFNLQIKRINKHSSDLTSFLKNWYSFFDGFKVLKFIHFARDKFYPNQTIVSQAKILARKMWGFESADNSALYYLTNYRDKDRLA